MEKDSKGRIKKQYDDEYIISLLEESINKGTSINRISKRESISVGTLSYRAKKLGYSLSQRKNTLNESYFDEIDTELKAYFLGFIMADGCVTITSKSNKFPNRLVVSISSADRVILEKFKEDINYSKDIEDYIPSLSTYANYQMSRITINSKHICNKLSHLGVTKNKTGNETIPNISEDLIPHFIRGFFDGDGTATAGHISFCSSYSMCLKLKVIFRSWGVDGALSIIADTRKENIYKISIFKKRDKKIFYNKVYKNSDFYLKRKHDKLKD